MSEEKVEAKSSEPSSDTVEFKSLEEFRKYGFKAIIEATRNSNALPANRDYNFYKTHDSFNKIINSEASHILSTINTILNKNDIHDNIKNKGINEKIELVVEANDVILERVAMKIDEMNGLRKLPEQPIIQTVRAELPINGSWNRVNKFTVDSAIHGNDQTKAIQLLAAKNIVRPQKFFKDIIENGNNYPWKPRITEKPNSLKPLALYIEDSEFGEIYSHPYEVELEKFEPSEDILCSCTPVPPKPVKETPLHEVNTEEELNNMLEVLRKQEEIAVDLEHHSYRSFMGITCLMQISTKDADYLIDTLALRDKLHVLNEIFTRSSIVKIFHGAEMDVQWLQRDLSLYVVNMFDTHKAAKQLGYSGLSLAYLLQRFCSFIPNKQFQLADWRIRPLLEQLKSYAREDTHYLIYIYHMLKNELMKMGNGNNNILKAVFQESTHVCMKRYVKPRLTENSHMDMYVKSKRLFNNKQLFAFKHLFAWRDALAREEDESTGYILPNHMLLQISETLPKEVQGILACCNPIPPLVRANVVELHKIMLKAREQQLEKAIMMEDTRSRGAEKESVKLNVESPLHCPHDLTRLPEFRDDLPTLLGRKTSTNQYQKIRIEKDKSLCSIFNCEPTEEKPKKVSDLEFLGPYERYKLIKSFIIDTDSTEKEPEAKEENTEKDVDLSVQDRMAKLHDHYLKVKRNEEKKKEPKTLTEMGGSKKRKRDICEADFQPFQENSDNPILTTLPFDRKDVQVDNDEKKVHTSVNSKRKCNIDESNNTPNKKSRDNDNEIGDGDGRQFHKNQKQQQNKKFQNADARSNQHTEDKNNAVSDTHFFRNTEFITSVQNNSSSRKLISNDPCEFESKVGESLIHKMNRKQRRLLQFQNKILKRNENCNLLESEIQERIENTRIVGCGKLSKNNVDILKPLVSKTTVLQKEQTINMTGMNRKQRRKLLFQKNNVISNESNKVVKISKEEHINKDIINVEKMAKETLKDCSIIENMTKENLQTNLGKPMNRKERRKLKFQQKVKKIEKENMNSFEPKISNYHEDIQSNLMQNIEHKLIDINTNNINYHSTQVIQKTKGCINLEQGNEHNKFIDINTKKVQFDQSTQVNQNKKICNNLEQDNEPKCFDINTKNVQFDQSTQINQNKKPNLVEKKRTRWNNTEDNDKNIKGVQKTQYVKETTTAETNELKQVVVNHELTTNKKESDLKLIQNVLIKTQNNECIVDKINEKEACSSLRNVEENMNLYSDNQTINTCEVPTSNERYEINKNAVKITLNQYSDNEKFWRSRNVELNKNLFSNVPSTSTTMFIDDVSNEENKSQSIGTSVSDCYSPGKAIEDLEDLEDEAIYIQENKSYLDDCHINRLISGNYFKEAYKSPDEINELKIKSTDNVENDTIHILENKSYLDDCHINRICTETRKRKFSEMFDSNSTSPDAVREDKRKSNENIENETIQIQEYKSYLDDDNINDLQNKVLNKPKKTETEETTDMFIIDEQKSYLDFTLLPGVNIFSHF